MENPIEPTGPVSRRNFTKAMFTAAVATPFLAYMNRCEKPKSCTCVDPPQGKPAQCEFAVEGLEPEPHEPPIIATNGSLRIDIGREFGNPTDINQGGRKKKYKLKENYYTQILKVQVLTESEKSFATNNYYLNLNNAFLGLWLQNNKSRSNEEPVWDQIPDDPQIVFGYDVDGNKKFLTLETDAPLIASRFKNLRKYRYEHPGLQADHTFRLAKWSLYDPDTRKPIEDISGSKFEGDLRGSNKIDSFQLAITVGDLHRLVTAT